MRRTALQTLLFVATLLAALSPVGAAEPPYGLLTRGAPDFALKSSAGINVRLSESRGDVVVLTFWGSRCGVCIGQLAALNRLQSTYGSAGLVTLAVDVDDDQTAAKEFLAALPKSFPLLMDPAKGVARAYRVDSLPMLLLIDRSGTVRYVHRDYHAGDESSYLAQLKTLLDE
jgi:peroxiredoxin